MFAASKTAAPSGEAVYIESVFSTYLYTGTGATQTITNGIDLSGKGGLVWIKDRAGTYSGQAHQLTDTVRGYNSQLSSNSTGSASSNTNYVSSFQSTGFTLGASSSVNGTSTTWASWTFRKQAKFFDVVTYTGDGSTEAISHNLGSVPGCIMVKRTSTSGTNWMVYHRSSAKSGFTAAQSILKLNLTDAVTDQDTWTNTAPTSTTFYVKAGNSIVNANAETYVALLFAHNAGGFGLTGTDNVISCGSFNAASAGSVNLGYEPQWVIFKQSDGASDWYMVDNMRGFSNGTSTNQQKLLANSSAPESTVSGISPTATGFDYSAFGGNWIYIAIRRGPMKTPTSGTSVFSPVARTGTGASATVTGVGFSPDLLISRDRGTAPSAGNPAAWFDRLRGPDRFVASDRTSAEYTNTGELTSFNVDGVTVGVSASYNWTNANVFTYIYWFLRRAPGFFDVVCYTGTGSATTFNHNLTVVPELMIVKSRNNATNWAVYCAYLGGTNPANRYVLLNSSQSVGGTAVYWNDTAPTSTVFTVGTTAATNASSYTYVNYLFATVAGVSKVGSYTGTGTTLQVNCGFTAGARFVMIKRTDSNGDWYVWDTARGIVSGNDPYLLINSTAAEVTGTDYIDPLNAGFEISSTAPADINANGGTFIFLAIA